MQNKFGIYSLILGFITSIANADQVSVAIPNAYRQYAKDHQEVQASAEMQQRVKELVDQINSPQFQATQAEMNTRVRRLLNGESADTDSVDKNSRGTASKTSDRVVLFISESIPIEVLRRYAGDLAKIGGVMVLRGMKGGIRRLQPTIRLIGDIVKLDAECSGASCKIRRVEVIVDPVLFRDNQIELVPALAFIPNMEIASYCERGPDANRLNAAADIIYGDASLAGMLKALNGIRRDHRIESYIDLLEGVNHGKS